MYVEVLYAYTSMHVIVFKHVLENMSDVLLIFEAFCRPFLSLSRQPITKAVREDISLLRSSQEGGLSIFCCGLTYNYLDIFS